MVATHDRNRRRARPRYSWQRRVAELSVVVAFYGVFAYVLAPLAWRGYAEWHPALDSIPNITYAGDRHPGDPINLALIAGERDLKQSLLAAGWYPADPLTLKSCLEIAAGTVLHLPYDTAPVSSLYLWGRKEDLAFEQPVGRDPRRRHHVRFWKSDKTDSRGRPAWAGAATFDTRVGLSRTTAQITHHIAGDVDAERDHVRQTLADADQLAAEWYLDNFHTVRSGRNGGGDAWTTDGRLWIGVLRSSRD